MSDSEPLSIAEQIAAQKEQLAGMRTHAARLLEDGTSGRQVAMFLSTAMDRFLVSLVDKVVTASGTPVPDRSAVVAVGGTGRGELWPHSDIDLLFLSAKPHDGFAQLASLVVRDCWDFGIKLGHTVQTGAEARVLAKDEIQFATSLVSARTLVGDDAFVQTFKSRLLRDVIRKRQAEFIKACVTSRQEERDQSGQAVKQLEPDVKRAPGGLRDVHLMQWIAFAVSGITDLEGMGELVPSKDILALTDGYEFLSRIRFDLHLHAGRPHDTFTREDQMRIAEERGVQPDAGRRPVERLMQTYFRHTSQIAGISDQFVKRHQPRTLRARVMSPLTSHRFDGIYVMRNEGIDVVGKHKDEVCSDLEATLKLFLASLLNDVDPVPEILELIREAVPGYPAELSKKSGKLFRKILRSPGDLGRVLRTMYATGVLEHLIPQFAHTRGLIQFNQYHSFTVDEHTFRAIEAAVAFNKDDGRVGSAYRAVRHKASLHLAILLHDVGKGFERDHSELGAEIAKEVGPRFSMSPHKQEMISFLVLNHLKMSHLALRRDISDTQLIVEFARLIGSPEKLRMLYVLTAADITAVGPDVFTDWKADLLGTFYSRTMEVLSGTPEKHLEAERIKSARVNVVEEVEEIAEADIDEEWIENELDAMPVFYLIGESPNRIAQHLLRLVDLPDDGILVWGNYDPETDVVEYHVIARGEASVGCFHRVTGTLAALRMDILTAGICTTRDGVAIDAFRVTDNDFEGQIPPERIEEVAKKVRAVLAREMSVEDLQSRRRTLGDQAASDVSALESRVVIDNDCSRDFTVIDVFAYDRPGLLYALSLALHELGLSVQLARIGTHWDQVVDVFYVTDSEKRKVKNKEITSQIRERLIEVVNEST
ncbi:MAG: [protein-PII] uridylyltransferase [Planctomycetaceae bacterium]